MAWTGLRVGREGGDTLPPCNLATRRPPLFDCTHNRGELQTDTRIDVPPHFPPHPPSSAGDPLGGPRPRSLQSPQLTLRDSAGTPGNCSRPDWLAR
jgi:hypothetical protein